MGRGEGSVFSFWFTVQDQSNSKEAAFHRRPRDRPAFPYSKFCENSLQMVFHGLQDCHDPIRHYRVIFRYEDSDERFVHSFTTLN